MSIYDILRERHGTFTKIFTILFSNAVKTGNVPELDSGRL